MKPTVRERYDTYAAKHPSPISFMSWLWFRKQGKAGGLIGGKLATNQSAAGKASARKRWGRKK